MNHNSQERQPFKKLKLNPRKVRRVKNFQFSDKFLGVFLFLSLMGTAMVGSFVIREIKLSITWKLIQDCKGEEKCQGRIEALEKLVKAKRSLKSSDFSQTQLYFAKLSHAQLNHADFSHAKLSSAKLDYADLSNASLDSAQLNHANFSHANLSGTNLDNADLSNSSLYFTDLSNAQMNYAQLNYAQLNYANLDNASLDSAQLNYTNLSNASLDSADLYHADLDNADLSLANLYHADLDNANLSLANLYHANLEEANLYHANLIEVHNLKPSQIKSACYWETAAYRGKFDNEKKNWRVDEKLNQEYLEQLKQDKASNPKHPVDCHS